MGKYQEGIRYNANELNLIINPEFKKALRPLRKDEKDLLRKNLEEHGCIDSLILFIIEENNNEEELLGDGHNRYELCKELNIEVSVKYIKFSKQSEAILWIKEHNVARRNLTDREKTYEIGKLYEVKKSGHGGKRKSKKKDSSAQNGPLNTAEKIAIELKLGTNTVKRAEKFSKAIDNIVNTFGENIKQKILDKSVKINQKEVKEFTSLDENEKKEIIKKLTVDGVKSYKAARGVTIKEPTKEEKEQKLVKNIVDNDLNLLNINKLYFEELIARGNSSQAKGNYEEAINYYDKILNLNPKYKEALNSKVITLELMGKNKEALECLLKVSELNPNDDKIKQKIKELEDKIKQEEKKKEFITIKEVGDSYNHTIYNQITIDTPLVYEGKLNYNPKKS